MAGWRALVMALVGLAGCVAEGPATGTGAYVEISSGGAFSGATVTRVHSDDRVETMTSGPFGKDSQRRVKAGRDGVYDAVLAVVLADGPAVAAGQRAEPDCSDYGSDAVLVSPPADGFAGVSAACPDAGVQALQSKVLAVIRGE